MSQLVETAKEKVATIRKMLPLKKMLISWIIKLFLFIELFELILSFFF